MNHDNSLRAAAIAAAVIASTGVQAGEGGRTIYPVGVENYVCCAVPPPGFYGMVFGQHYRATKVKDNDGNDIPIPSPGFKVTANAVVPRFIWVTGQQIAGASLAVHAVLPLVSLDVSLPSRSQSKSGLGDIVFGPALGWHHSPQLHSVLALDIFAPTGGYNPTDLTNIGRNHWAVQAIGGVSQIDPSGLNADAKVMFGWNAKNKDFAPNPASSFRTDYRSGNEFIVDYDAGWGLGNGWVVGVGGYVFQQITDDEVGGATVANNKGRSFSIGPSVKYDSGKGWFVTMKYETEAGVRNRASGNGLWLKAVFPL
jgi:hypothetical protein